MTELSSEEFLDREPYEIIENPVLGHEYRYLERGTGDGEFFRAEFRYEAGAKHIGEHIHEQQEETWKVVSGALTVRFDGTERTLEAGEQITLPAGVPHYHGNPPDTPARVLYEMRPPLGIDAILRTLAVLAREGRTNADSIPNLLQSAVTFDAHPGTYETNPPVVVQKLLFKLLAPVGRLVGYSADYFPVENPSVE